MESTVQRFGIIYYAGPRGGRGLISGPAEAINPNCFNFQSEKNFNFHVGRRAEYYTHVNRKIGMILFCRYYKKYNILLLCVELYRFIVSSMSVTSQK